jgi:hypothetical protein
MEATEKPKHEKYDDYRTQGSAESRCTIAVVSIQIIGVVPYRPSSAKVVLSCLLREK